MTTNRLTERTRVTKAPNLTTTNAPDGYVRVLAPPFDVCPHCHESNTNTKGYVYRVADERGLHWECEACSYAWRPDGTTVGWR